MLLKRSKAALALGVILGGASLFGGEAKAFSTVTLSCFFNGGGGATPPPSPVPACDDIKNDSGFGTIGLPLLPWKSIETNMFQLGDKKFTFIGVTSKSKAPGHVEFTWIDPDSGVTTYGNDSWSVSTIFDSPVINETGWIDYTLQVTKPGWSFSGVKLDSEILTPDDVKVEKFITEATPSPYLTSKDGIPVPTPPAMAPLGGTFITVRDKWTVGPDGALTSFVNTYEQVPAPLPLLGVGAVFGSIRKLRKFSSQLKTFSMG